MSQDEYYYSTKYEDDFFEYRHVHVPLDIARKLPKSRLLTESEWRALGVQQSLGWVHYMIHGYWFLILWKNEKKSMDHQKMGHIFLAEPERHVMLFRRPKPGVDPTQAAAVAKIRDSGKDLDDAGDQPAVTASPEKMEWTVSESGDANNDKQPAADEKQPKGDEKNDSDCKDDLKSMRIQ